MIILPSGAVKHPRGETSTIRVSVDLAFFVHPLRASYTGLLPVR